ncbi:MAG: hypothetical protein BWY74_03013 [Firmicutes bacterium ADurb.Bin419]|nr:MAG: hypothetical protein BWY74_03013 [Firmicutes bacterium ADurb.Bin419]
MLELLKTSITGVNLIPTTLLGIVVLYWIIVIIGAIDIDFFDFDLDLPDGDIVSNPFYEFLGFLNIGDIPFMLVLSVFSLSFWIIAMSISVSSFVSAMWISAVLLLPNLVVSLFITKVVTYPLKGLFRGILKDTESEIKIEGQLCTLLCDITYGRLGQAEIDRVGSSILINVKIDDEQENMYKGDKAFVIKKDSDKDCYIIKKFEGVR